MPDWEKMKAEYIRGGTSYRKLAEKYGVSASSVMRKASNQGWVELAKQKAIKTEAKLVEKLAEKDSKRADKINHVADLLLDKIEEKVNSGEFIAEPKDVRAITAALKDLRDIKGIKSDADLEEQKARIAKLRKDCQDDQKDTSIRFVIEGPEEYLN